MLGALFVKHYAENTRKYAAMYGVTVAVPIIFGLLTRRSEVSQGMLISMLVLDIFVIMHISMNELRDRRSAVIVNTLPVSIVERYAFIFINTTLVFLACFAVLGFATKAIVDAMYAPMIDFSEMFLRNDRLWISLAGSHATAMIINAVARRRLILTYVAAFVISIAVQYAVARLGGYDVTAVDDLKMNLNMVMVPLFWAASFILLYRKQVNW